MFRVWDLGVEEPNYRLHLVGVNQTFPNLPVFRAIQTVEKNDIVKTPGSGHGHEEPELPRTGPKT